MIRIGTRGLRPGAVAPLAFATALSIAFARPALAYVDPAASSLLLPVFLGGFAGRGVLLRRFWGGIRKAGRRGVPPSDEGTAGPDAPR